MSELETKLDSLLAADFHTEPGCVDGEFIREWRDTHEVSYSIETAMGGWVGAHSTVMSRDELRRVEEKADAFLDQFSSGPLT
jgi:hypothetical protein